MEFEVGQKWQNRSGEVREVLAASADAIAYSSSNGGMYACTPEQFRLRVSESSWELIHPKPVPEGWVVAKDIPAVLWGMSTPRDQVMRVGDGVSCSVGIYNKGVNPDSLKAAIDYVMDVTPES